MFQNRCSFLYNSSALLLSFLCIVWISFYPGTSSLEPLSLFYDLIASYYTKGKWQQRQAYLFCFESYHVDKNFFSLHLLIFLLLIWRVHLIRSCLVWKRKFVFCFWDWQINLSIFANVIRLQLSLKQVTNTAKIWIGLTYIWHKNENKLFLNFISVFEPLRYRNTCHALWKFVNTVCGGGQLLVTGSQGPITRVPGVRIPCLRVTSPKAQGPSSKVSGSQSLGSQGCRSQSPGSGVLGPHFRLCHIMEL